jgi:hypothetical protein
LKIREATADRGYGSAEIIRTLQERGAETYIPLWSGRVGKSKYFRGGLIYEKDRDRFRCPQGKYLYPNQAICENHKRYVSLSADCRHCPQAATCPAKTRKAAPHQRFVLRSLDQDLFEEVQARMRDPTFRHKMSERLWKCEGLFAEAKQNHGLSRARYRGRRKVQIQAYLSATVQNLKRLVFLFYHWLAGWWSSLVFDRQLGRHLDEVDRPKAKLASRPPDFFNTQDRILTHQRRPPPGPPCHPCWTPDSATGLPHGNDDGPILPKEATLSKRVPGAPPTSQV